MQRQGAHISMPQHLTVCQPAASLTLQCSRALSDPCSHQRSGDSRHACDVTAVAQVPAEGRDDTSFSSPFFLHLRWQQGCQIAGEKSRLVGVEIVVNALGEVKLQKNLLLDLGLA